MATASAVGLIASVARAVARRVRQPRRWLDGGEALPHQPAQARLRCYLRPTDRALIQMRGHRPARVGGKRSIQKFVEHVPKRRDGSCAPLVRFPARKPGVVRAAPAAVCGRGGVATSRCPAESPMTSAISRYDSSSTSASSTTNRQSGGRAAKARSTASLGRRRRASLSALGVHTPGSDEAKVKASSSADSITGMRLRRRHSSRKTWRKMVKSQARTSPPRNPANPR